MKKIVNNLSIILFVTGITLMLVSWLLEIPDLYKLLIPVGFVIILFGLFVDFKYIEEKRSDLIDELDDEELNDGFTVISVEQQKRDKQLKEKAERAKSDESWRTLISSIDGTMEPEEVFNMLKNYKFPKKW